MLKLNNIKNHISKFISFDQTCSEHGLLKYITLYTIACACILFYITMPPQVSLLTLDSESYINFDASRTVGYPLFLTLIKKLTGGYESIPLIQLTLFTISVTQFTATFMRSIKSFFLPLIFLLITFSLDGIMQFHFEIMTESLFLSALMFLGTLWLLFIGIPSRTHVIWLGVIVGTLILIRPSGYVIFIAASLLFCVKWSWIKQYSLSFIIPVICALSLGSFVNYHLHGFFKTQSFLGHNLFGKVAFILKEDMTDTNPIKQKMITHMTKAMLPFQQSLAPIQSNKHYYNLAAPIYDILRYHFLGQFQSTIPEMNTIPNHDDFYKDIAMSVIKQNPIGYGKDVLFNYAALWLLWDLNTKAERAELNTQIQKLKASETFKAVKLDYAYIKTYGKSSTFIHLVRTYLIACFMVSLYFMFGALIAILKRKELTNESLIGLFCALAIHASFGLTALLQAGYPRYAMIMWTYIFIMSLVFFKMMCTFILTKRKPFLS